MDTLTVSKLSRIFAPYNPRRITDEKFEALRRSLREFGSVEPVVVNKRSEERGWPPDSDPCVVGGHQRIRAAKAEKLKTFPVIWVDETPHREKQLNVALNLITGEWDEPKLFEFLQQWKEEGIEFDLAGVDAAFFAELEAQITGGDFEEMGPIGRPGQSNLRVSVRVVLLNIDARDDCVKAITELLAANPEWKGEIV